MVLEKTEFEIAYEEMCKSLTQANDKTELEKYIEIMGRPPKDYPDIKS